MSVPREHRVRKERPCPICGRTTWCFFLDGGAVVWCGRESRGSFKVSGDGWLHRLRDDRPPLPMPRPRPLANPIPSIDFEAAQRRFSAGVPAAEARALADSLGVNVTSLRRLGLGWATSGQLLALGTRCRGDGVWTFPMRDGAGAVIGIRTRGRDGAKFSVVGSQNGLFIPEDVAGGGQLLLPEGPTSAAALRTLGFSVVGRPNCSAGVGHVRALLKRLRPGRVVVVGDNDAKPDGRWPGRDGARQVARGLGGCCRDVRVVLPVPRAKDARDWLMAGADPGDVQDRIETEPVSWSEELRNVG